MQVVFDCCWTIAQLLSRFFVEHVPVAAYVRCLKEKEWKKWTSVFYCTQSDILCGIARFSRGNKSKLRTFQPQKWKKIKNSQPQTKFTGSYKKSVLLKKVFRYFGFNVMLHVYIFCFILSLFWCKKIKHNIFLLVFRSKCMFCEHYFLPQVKNIAW